MFTRTNNSNIIPYKSRKNTLLALTVGEFLRKYILYITHFQCLFVQCDCLNKYMYGLLASWKQSFRSHLKSNIFNRRVKISYNIVDDFSYGTNNVIFSQFFHNCEIQAKWFHKNTSQMITLRAFSHDDHKKYKIFSYSPCQIMTFYFTPLLTTTLY